MSYLNGVQGYRNSLLTTRSVVKKNNYAIIEPDGIVKNVIPGFENCEITILSTPKMGASFVDYLMAVLPGGKNLRGFGYEGVEVFLYVFEGELDVWTKNEPAKKTLTAGGYIYLSEGDHLFFENKSSNKTKTFLYKRRYQPIEGYKAFNYVGNVNDLEWVHYEGMKDVLIKDLLPSATELGFDMNFHILSFEPGASHGYIETHFQEHGAYIYSGQGVYNLDNEWVPVQKGDYIFMSAYSLQASYAVGRDEPFAYIYSKDCNRDADL